MILIRRLVKLISLRPTSIPRNKSTSTASKSTSTKARARTQIFLTKDNSIGFFSSNTKPAFKLNPALKLVNQRLQMMEVVGSKTLLGAQKSINSSWKPGLKLGGVALVTALYHWESSRFINGIQVIGGIDSAQETISIGGNSTLTSRSDMRSYGSLLGSNSPFTAISKPLLPCRTSINQYQPQFGLQFRTYATTREKQVETITSQIKPDKLVDLTMIMKDLRELELLDVLRGQPQKSGNSWKDAARCLYPLFHTVDESEKKIKVTFQEIVDILPPVYSIAWSVISERILKKRVDRLAVLSADEQAELLFLQVYGVGPTYSKKFVAAGAKTLASLPKKVKLTRAQMIGLTHFDDINRLIPRSEMDLLREELETRIHSVDPKFELEILGSYRRGIPFSSDIDLVVRHKTFVDAEDKEIALELMDSVVECLGAAELIRAEDLITRGPKKFSGLIKLPDHKRYRRIDVRLAPFHSYPYMQLGSTGDSFLMKFMRAKAKSMGMCLNEYAMGDKYEPKDQNPNGVKPDTMRLVKNEKEIFELLGLPYLAPNEREFATWRDKYVQAGVDLSYLTRSK